MWVGAARDSSVDGAHRRFHFVVAAGDFEIGVSAVVGAIRSNDGDLLCSASQFRKRRAEGDAGMSGLDFAGYASELFGCGHLWIEEFDVWRTALEKEKDDGLVAEHGSFC